MLDAIISLAPRAVSLHPTAQSREVWLRFRGLLFARWDDGRVFFEINDAREELTPASRPALKHLLHELEVHRHPFASDSRHSLYRVQPERWLESIVREDVTRIDAMLDQRFVYAQVFANAESEHGMLDLLTVTGGHQTKGQRAHPSATAGSGLLVVFAGSCRAQRSLAMVIYFQGVALQQAPRLVFLVAPPCDSIRQRMIISRRNLRSRAWARPEAGAGDYAWPCANSSER